MVSDTLVPIFLGLGSNINAKVNLQAAVTKLRLLLHDIQVSVVYRNPAQGFSGPDFLNAVVYAQTTQSLQSLKLALKGIERYCGRQRDLEQCKGSRTLDIDLLSYGTLRGMYHGILLPRPEIAERAFVYWPLLELEPQFQFQSPTHLSQKAMLLTDIVDVSNGCPADLIPVDIDFD